MILKERKTRKIISTQRTSVTMIERSMETLGAEGVLARGGDRLMKNHKADFTCELAKELFPKSLAVDSLLASFSGTRRGRAW
jgi:hypothetical protein